MKTIALSMAYNEGPLIYKNLAHIYDLCDQLVIFEGTVSPFDDQPAHSTDNTVEEIERFIADFGTDKVVFWSPDKNNDIDRRENYEGWVKNEMLKRSAIEHGDLIWMVDVDEFYKPEGVQRAIEAFRKDDKLEHLPIEEYQFAYSMLLWFKAGHDGRYLRYVDGCYYTGSQHLIYPDGRDISRENGANRLPRELSQMYHLCWVKHPKLIREKVQTFKRPSFTLWYNECYLKWPFSPEVAYENNTRLSRPRGWAGGGFCEGQTEILRPFGGELPECLKDIDVNWVQYILDNVEELRIDV